MHILIRRALEQEVLNQTEKLRITSEFLNENECCNAICKDRAINIFRYNVYRWSSLIYFLQRTGSEKLTQFGITHGDLENTESVYAGFKLIYPGR